MICTKNLDGAHNRGHKQTDLIIMDFAKAFDKVHVPYRRLAYEPRYEKTCLCLMRTNKMQISLRICAV